MSPALRRYSWHTICTVSAAAGLMYVLETYIRQGRAATAVDAAIVRSDSDSTRLPNAHSTAHAYEGSNSAKLQLAEAVLSAAYPAVPGQHEQVDFVI